MNSHFQFAHPWALGLLLLIPAVAILRGRFGREAAVQYSGLSLLGPLVRRRKSRAGGWLSALMYATLACLLVALPRLAAGEAVTTVALDLGYESPTSFSTMFRRVLGKSPSHYRP